MIKYIITPEDSDFSGFIRLQPLCNIIISAAGQDADINGFGINSLLKRGLSWVLSQLSVRVVQMPKMGDAIEIKTWIERVNRVFTLRYFQIYNGKGELLVVASSYWSMINYKTRAIQNIVTELGGAIEVQVVDHGFAPPVKVEMFTYDTSFNRAIKYSDIDINKHLTATRYVDWACDTVSDPLEKFSKIKQVDLNYYKESFIDDTITICSLESDDVNLCAFKDAQQKVLFSCKLTFTD